MTIWPIVQPVGLAVRALGISLAIATVAMSTMQAASAAPVALAPHRAVYDISLDRTASGSGVAELSGRMVYELKGSPCDGYAQTTRFVMRIESPKGKATISDLRSVYWENGKATRFRFEASQFENDRLTDRTVGSAKRKTFSGQLRVTIKKPKQSKSSLSPGALFPVQHSIKILAAARAGQRIFSSDLYDGSGKGNKIYETTAVLGDRKAPGYNATLPPISVSKPVVTGQDNKKSQAVTPARSVNVLDGQVSWPVSLSYFEKTKKAHRDSIPAYELAFVFFENGVSRKLFIDYGNFAIRGKLVRLDMLKSAHCPSK